MFGIEMPLRFEQWRTRTSDPARLWGIALGADLARHNRSRLDCLHTGYTVAIQRKSLKLWWSVSSRKELRYQLECLFDGGHSHLFSQILYALSEALPFKADLDAPTIRRIEFVRARLPQCRQAGHVRAFDFGRVPNLARFGFTADYISAKEAWQWIARAALATQPLFASWSEFATNYRLGHEFWDSADPSATHYFQYREWLLHDAKSPWIALPWMQTLGEHDNLSPTEGVELPNRVR
jgi:hypothetical protein